MKKLSLLIIAACITMIACGPPREEMYIRLYSIPVTYSDGTKEAVTVWSEGPHFFRVEQGDLHYNDGCCHEGIISSHVRSIGEIRIQKGYTADQLKNHKHIR